MPTLSNSTPSALSVLPGAQPPPQAPASVPDFIDIRGPIPPGVWEQHGTLIIAGIILFIALVALAAWLIVRARRKKIQPLSPAQIAIKEIETAREFFTGEDKQYCGVLSQAVRRYIETALSLPAPERTTEEFLEEAKFHPLLKGQPIELLHAFLGGCDLVKFARQSLNDSGRAQLADQAEAFVEGTEEKLAPPPTEGDALV